MEQLENKVALLEKEIETLKKTIKNTDITLSAMQNTIDNIEGFLNEEESEEEIPVYNTGNKRKY